MAPLSPPSSSPPSTPIRRRTKSCTRRCERACCTAATYFPLLFVYSLTTWAAWVEAGIGLDAAQDTEKSKPWVAKYTSLVGVILYLLLNSSYTVAVFTDPGSPTKTSSSRNATYSSLPTTEPSHDFPDLQSITVSSTGSQRYCKKCQTSKPDRTHHCSTCRRCVLKMDHHCPWLATCLGLHNYKAFVLFLIYTCLFCWVCFLSSARWVYTEIFAQNQFLEEFAPVNVILLAIISGIIGLVLTGFTSWHLYLCARGQTTIECLEKTRYLSGVRRQVERQRQDQLHNHNRTTSHGVAETLQRAGEQILEFHANAVPGATRLEEGEEHTSPVPSIRNQVNSRTGPSSQAQTDSPAQQALRKTYSTLERQREHDRYAEYLDDRDSEKLPNAFDLGWRRNLAHLFGPSPLLWFLPVCNTTGDGWRWEVSQKWVVASEEAARRRERSEPALTQTERRPGAGGYDGSYDRDLEEGPGTGMSMRTLQRPGRAWGKAKQRREFEDGEPEGYEVSSDEDTDDGWEGEGARNRDRDRGGEREGDEDRGWKRWK